MPAKFKRCVAHVQASGKPKGSAYAICTANNAGDIKQYRKLEGKAKGKKLGVHS